MEPESGAVDYQKILNSPVQYLKGIGPRKAYALSQVGVETVEDLIYYLPRKYLDRSSFTPINQLKINSPATVIGQVEAQGLVRGRKSTFRVILKDQTGFLTLVWFANQKYMQKVFKPEDTVIASGEIRFYNGLEMAHPEYEIVSGEGEDLVHTGRVIPLYPSTAGLKKFHMDSRGFRRVLKPALDKVLKHIGESLPKEIIEKQKLMRLPEALFNIHFPESMEAAEKAHQRLAFDELFYLELMLALRKKSQQKPESGIIFKRPGQLVRELLAGLKFDLTDSQKKVLREIVADMTSSKPMSRLLQGDVGSGKTIVALICCLMAIESGYQAAFMAPTEILAEQHYINFHEFLERLGIKVALLTSSLVKTEKDGLTEQISSGAIDLAVGTHALIQEKVQFKRLGLCVIDEQHRFGVMQRGRLKQKGEVPDVLIMTATPIPRTLALTAYGDLDVSVIDQMPPGRRPVYTMLKGEKDLSEVYRFLENRISEGRQVYVVYPLIEETEKSDLKAASEAYEKLKSEIFPQYRVALIHGRIERRKREEIMNKFRQKEFDILVATTVIEVGLDIPNATVMVIEHAERFGLSQLHQLRGRVGRGAEQSHCFLIAQEPWSQEARIRLQAMITTTDGFKIAETDLTIRGPGEFFGTRQHGLPELKVADLVKDLKTLLSAREAAFGLIQQDPKLSLPEHGIISENFNKRYRQRFDFISIG
jgi:ATP-dependent DNA helicase RecG